MPQLFTTPDHYIQSIDWVKETALLIPMSRSTYSQSSFLDQRTIANGSPQTIELSKLHNDYATLQPSAKPLNFIFHTTFCGSTLLSRCLDKPGVCLSYKEPYLLHQLAFRKRPKWKPADTQDTNLYQNIALALLSRTYSDTEIPLIKPSESCNNIARDLLQQHSESKALLLYSDLSSFVISMLKHPNRREYLHASIPRAQQDLQKLGYTFPEDLTLSDAQIAGFVWFSLIAQHLNLLEDQSLNITSLNVTYLYNQPFETLKNVSSFFNLPHETTSLKKEAEQGAFLKDAKNTGVTYDKTEQAQKKMHLKQKFSSAIREAEEFVYEFNAQKLIEEKLPRHISL